jgi:hypothetical protein
VVGTQPHCAGAPTCVCLRPQRRGFFATEREQTSNTGRRADHGPCAIGAPCSFFFGIRHGEAIFRARHGFQKARMQPHRENDLDCLVIARSEATKQSRTSPKTGLLRFARNVESDPS